MAQNFILRPETAPRPLAGAVSLSERSNGQPKNGISQVDIPALNQLAVLSLVSLFDERERLFSRRLIFTSDGLYREGASRKHTLVALLGLQRFSELIGFQQLDISAIQSAVLSDTGWVQSLGDLGLLIWFVAECAPQKLGELLKEFEFETALDAFSDAREAHTRAVAWFLAGISHAQLACPEISPDLTDIAVEAFHLLQDNQSDCGIYGRAGCTRFPLNTYWRRFGTFSDQVFAIYALTSFARAFEIEEPLGAALSCANSICSLQGDHGEWWSLYDKRACRVVNRYPVRSLHQDGTAPLALLTLEEATGQKFHESVCKGLSWVGGINELGDDLRSFDRGLIWDSMETRWRLKNYWEGARSYFNLSPEKIQRTLRIRCEARPDHFGWLLYALGRYGLPNSAMQPQAKNAEGSREITR